MGLGLARNLGGGSVDPIALLYPLGTEGAYWTAQIDALSQNSFGSLPVTAAGQFVGLALSVERWAGQTLTQVMSAQPQLFVNGDLAAGLTGYTDTSTGTGVINANDERLNIVGGGDASNIAVGSSSLPTAANKVIEHFYDLAGVLPSGSLSYRIGTSIDGTQITSFSLNTLVVPGTFRRIFDALGAATIITLRYAGSAPGDTALFDNFSAKEIPSFPARQATAGAQPSYQEDPPRLVGDGSDDRLPTTLNPTLVGGIGFVGTVTNEDCVVFGSQPASDGRCFVGLNADGEVCGAVGEEGFTTIASIGDKRGQRLLAFLTWEGVGGDVTLWINGVIAYRGAQAGAVNTTIPLLQFGLNANGTPVNLAAAGVEVFPVVNYVPSDQVMAALPAAYGL
jgi:hypothetical protein